MDRNNKGHSFGTHTDNYCVVDLETTGVFIRSAEIIEIAAVKVRNNDVVDTFRSLVNPLCHIPADATAVNHITDEMVKNAPTLEMILDSFLQFIGNDVIVGYNNAAFDMNIIYDAVIRICNKAFGNDYIDIMHSARRCISNIDNFKLETICKYYGLDTEGEHRALKDCYLTKSVYDNLYMEYGDEAFAARESYAKRSVHYSVEIVALRELQTLLEEIIKDGKITYLEFSHLRSWMENHRDLQGNYTFDRVFNALDRVLEDGKVTSEELDELQDLFSDYVDPVKNRSCHDTIESIKDKHVVLTGEFDYGSKNDVSALINKAGGIIDKGVKKATDYVVVGAKGSDNWKTGNYGGKIQKAMELKDKGIDIKIIEEGDFIPAINCIIDEGMSDVEDIDREDLSTEEGYDFQVLIGDWKQNIRDMLELLIRKYELPNDSLYLSENKSQNDPNVIISYSVCIWEPDYPPVRYERPGMNKIVVTISPSNVKSRPDDLDLNIREAQERDLHQFMPGDAEILSQSYSEKNLGAVRIRFKNYSSTLVEYVRKNTEYCIRNYSSKADKFGCCSRFEKCSDAKKCIHENKLYSKACAYREKLEKGRIFYGKNRNID